MSGLDLKVSDSNNTHKKWDNYERKTVQKKESGKNAEPGWPERLFQDNRTYNLDDILGTVAGENCMFGVLKEGVKGSDFLEVLREKIPGLEE